MPFCPHCGKPAGDQATTCVACGKAIQAVPTKARGGFKGTMMMTSPAVLTGGDGGGRPPSTSAVDAEPQPPAPDAPGAAEMGEPGAPRSMGNRPSALKATMVGGMEALDLPVGNGAPSATPPSATPPAATPPAATPPAAAPASPPVTFSKNPAFAQTAPAEPTEGLPAGTGNQAVQAAPADRPRLLPEQGIYPTEPRESGARWLIAGAVGVLVIAALGGVAAKVMGLL